MKKIFIGIGVILIALTGCVQTCYVMSDYKDIRIEDKSLVIIYPDIYLENTKDVTDDLGEGNPKKIYSEFFDFNFKGRMAQLSTFSEVNFDPGSEANKFIEKPLEVGKEELIYLNLPADGEIVKTDSVYGDFVLFIQDYRVAREVTTSSPMFMVSPGGGGSWIGGGSSSDLRHSFNYAIWDNSERRLVSYGKVDSATGFFLAMTTETWNQSITDISKKILFDTPFENFPVEQNSRHN